MRVKQADALEGRWGLCRKGPASMMLDGPLRKLQVLTLSPIHPFC